MSKKTNKNENIHTHFIWVLTLWLLLLSLNENKCILSKNAICINALFKTTLFYGIKIKDKMILTPLFTRKTHILVGDKEHFYSNLNITSSFYFYQKSDLFLSRLFFFVFKYSVEIFFFIQKRIEIWLETLF